MILEMIQTQWPVGFALLLLFVVLTVVLIRPPTVNFVQTESAGLSRQEVEARIQVDRELIAQQACAIARRIIADHVPDMAHEKKSVMFSNIIFEVIRSHGYDPLELLHFVAREDMDGPVIAKETANS